MRRFEFRLQSVLELRKTARDECRARLAESFAAAQHIEGQRESLERELGEIVQLRQDSQIGPLDVQHLARVQSYESALRGDLTVLRDKIVAIEQRIELARQAFIAADQQLRVLTRLRDKHLEQHRRRATSAEARELDDLVRSTASVEQ